MIRTQFEYGFDFKTDVVGRYKSAEGVAIAQGLLVDLDDDGEVAVSDEVKYFLMQEVTLDGPSWEERQRGIVQYDVKAGSYVPLIQARVGNIIRTKNVAENGGGDIVVGDLFDVSDGVFVKDGAGTKAECIEVVDSTDGVYRLRILEVD